MKKALRLAIVFLASVAALVAVFHVVHPGARVKAAENGVLLTGTVKRR